MLRAAGVDPGRVRYMQLPYDDTWLRDSGPLTLRSADGRLQLNDFRFTGWGGKFDATQDDALVAGLVKAGTFANARHRRIDWARKAAP